jgi:thiol-disulfide isomerase/thioredoxin
LEGASRKIVLTGLPDGKEFLCRERKLLNMTNLQERESIEKLIAENEMVLLYFGSESCSVCTSLKPKVWELLKSFPKIKSIEIDVEKHLAISAQYNIFTIPAVILFIEGKEIIREARHISVEDINNKIERYYELFYGNE